MAKIFSYQLLVLYALLLQTVKSNIKRPSIHSLHINTDIKYRFATTVVKSKVVNSLNEAHETEFVVKLPKDAFITTFVMIRKEKEYRGHVKEKAKAKQEYEKAKQKGQTAGHIGISPIETNTFRIKVNVGPTEKVTFELTYQELLHRTNGVYNHFIFMNPGQLVNDFKITVDIQESRNITSLGVGHNMEVSMEQPTPKRAIITYTPNQREQTINLQMAIPFEVKYDVERNLDAGELLVVDGYFVHFFAPTGIEPLPMDIVFVLDTSGSMSGRKIDQLQNAMKKILDDIRPNDRLYIITFQKDLQFWSQEIEFATKTNIRKAKAFIRKMRASGSTDINKAMLAGLSILNSHTEKTRAPVIVFLTDGQPTEGVTNTADILSNIRQSNNNSVPIFSLAFGKGADYEFVRKVAAQNNGVGRKIYQDSTASLQITGFYETISTVLLRNVTFKYLHGVVNETTLTKQTFNTFFDGSEFIVAGKFVRDAFRALDFVVSGKGSIGLIDLELPENSLATEKDFNVSKGNHFQQITEKMWAYLTIKQILQKIEASSENKTVADLRDRALQLSLKYQFVTPLTSMIVTLPTVHSQEGQPESINEDVQQYVADLTDRQNTYVKQPKITNVQGTVDKKVTSIVQDQSQSILRTIGGVRSRVRTRIRNVLPRLSGLFSKLKRAYTDIDPKPTSLSVQTSTNHGLSTELLNYPSTTSSTQKPNTFVKPTAKPRQTSPIQDHKGSGNMPNPVRPLLERLRGSTSPMILIDIPGISIPMCPRFNLETSGTYILIKERSTGAEFRIKTTRNSPQAEKIIHIIYREDKNDTDHVFTVGGGENESFVGSMGNLTVGDLNILKKDKLDQMIRLSTDDGITDRAGLLSFFDDFTGRVNRIINKRRQTIGKMKMKKGNKKYRLRAIKINISSTNMRQCWFVNHRGISSLGMRLSDYKIM